jgi:hypothetical protein
MSKFVILHTDSCTSPGHWQILQSGERVAGLPENTPGQHRDSIAVMVHGSFTNNNVDDPRLLSLKALLKEIRLRYPAIRLAGHRQVRGSATACPGDHFPLAEITRWWAGPMVTERDQHLDDLIAAAYGMRPQ